MKPFNAVRKYGRQAAVGAVILAPMSAMAEVPTTVTSAITTAVEDVGTIGGLILAVIVAIAAFAWMRKITH